MIIRPRLSARPRALAAPLALLGAALLIACLLAAPAHAEVPTSPWWHLSSGSRPAYLRAGGGEAAKPGTDEVQELTLHPAELFSYLVSPNLTQEQIENEEFTEPGQSAEVSPGESAAELQAALEGVAGYGPGNVKVEAVGSEGYKITFLGALAEQPVSVRLGYPSGRGILTELTPGAGPTTGTDGELYMTAENLGDADTAGAVKLTDVIPHGLHALGVAGSEPFAEGNFKAREPIPCSLEEKGGVQSATCTLSKALAPYDQIEMRINVKLQPGAHSGELNQLSVSGGGAPQSSIKRPITVSEAPVPFGVESYEMGLEEEGGATTTQAGAHPFQLTTTIALNQLKDINPLEAPPEHRPEVTPAGLAKDLSFKLPSGLIGNATVLPQCTTAQFFETVGGQENRCPPDSAVGVATTIVHEPATVGTSTLTEPIFNLEARKGEPARFGFYVVLANSPVFIDTSVRSGSDYGVNVNVQNITQTGAFLSSEVTFWGTPADPRHDKQRGWGCLFEARNGSSSQPCTPSEEQHPRPLLSLPTSCSRTLSTSVEGDSWEDPGSFFDFTGAFEPQGPLLGCNRLSFAPQLKLASENTEAAHPSGMTIDVHVPQEANQNAAGLASSNIRSTTITFPAGFSVNPSSADGLQACAEGEVGYLNARGAEEELLFSPDLPQPFCPDAAKVGTVRIKTPLLPAGQYLEEGGLYLATPAPNGEGSKNPFNSLIALYIVVKDPISGVLLKLPGEVSLDPSTGQLSTTFQNTPDLNAEDIEVSLTAGPRAPLASPAACGTYPVQASFTPWSGTAPVSSSASLQVTSGPGGSPCPSSPLPFSPSLAAGTTNINAGAFSPLSTSINREDANQQISSVAVHTPPGVSGVLSGVTLCPEANANAGSCPQNSLIGHSSVSVGFGSDPFTVTSGQVFLTETYKGAPFGLSILTPAIAGPFNLGNVIVRAKLEVNPYTAALTATTDESGPYAIPHILDGIPLDIRHVNVTIDRANFTFNPTSCAPQSITATVKALEGASAQLSAPFQAASCQTLKFAPKFAVSVSGKSTKANGTGLQVKLSYPSAPLGTYANLAKVKVSLPKQLPSRLTTLNKACVAAVFEANPANCPKESHVGSAKVSTPLLPVPLIGTAYFVSHAAESFPDLTIVLKGYGITVILIGNTQIKKGITTTTFKATPDVPFTSFELSLPAQPYSALTTNTNICKAGTKLRMPTEFSAQNGALISQSTPIKVTGCAKALTRAQHLSKALKSCRKKHNKAKRKACEAQARRRYGSKPKKKRK
jgi:hypothetical protein